MAADYDKRPTGRARDDEQCTRFDSASRTHARGGAGSNARNRRRYDAGDGRPNARVYLEYSNRRHNPFVVTALSGRGSQLCRVLCVAE